MLDDKLLINNKFMELQILNRKSQFINYYGASGLSLQVLAPLRAFRSIPGAGSVLKKTEEHL